MKIEETVLDQKETSVQNTESEELNNILFYYLNNLEREEFIEFLEDHIDETDDLEAMRSELNICKASSEINMPDFIVKYDLQDILNEMMWDFVLDNMHLFGSG